MSDNMQGPQVKKGNGVVIAIVVIVIIVLIVVGVAAFSPKAKDQVDGTTATTTTATTTSDTPADVATSSTETTSTSKSTYKDGTYTAVGDYRSPGGSQTLTVSLTLKDDIITDATATEGATDPESKRYQTIFISGYKQYVIGKDISTVSLDKVSGASLTPAGFNDAVAKIKVQAKA